MLTTFSILLDFSAKNKAIDICLFGTVHTHCISAYFAENDGKNNYISTRNTKILESVK